MVPEALVFQTGVAPSTEVRTLLLCLLRSQKAPGVVAGNALHLFDLAQEPKPPSRAPASPQWRGHKQCTPEPGAAPIFTSLSSPSLLLLVVQKLFIQPLVSQEKLVSLIIYV